MRLIAWLLAVVLLATSAQANAQANDYPNKVIKIVVPFPPGGTTDLFSREVAKFLGEKFRVPVLVDNKPGATGTIGTAAAARAAPDGYTLLAIGSPHAINSSVRNDLSYDPVKDFDPVALLIKLPHAITVHPSLPVNTTQELIDYAKKNPTAVKCGVTMNTSNGLATDLFEIQTGAPMNPITYNGDGHIIRDLLGGHVNCHNGIANQTLSHAKEGRLRLIATTGTTRLKAAPDAPTLIELGMKDFEAASWNGIVVPAGTPKPIIDKLATALLELAKDPGFIERWEAMGAAITPDGPEGLRNHLAADIARWKPVVEKTKAAGK